MLRIFNLILHTLYMSHGKVRLKLQKVRLALLQVSLGTARARKVQIKVLKASLGMR